jgi:hypothetical protein
VKQRLIKLSLAALVAVQLLTPWTARAADAAPVAAPTGPPRPLSLTISPLVINLTGDPGKTVTTDLRVKQDGGGTEVLKIGLQKFSADGDTGKPQLADRQPGDDYFDWIHFDRTTFTAPNGVWQTIHATINLPKTAAFGYYYAVTFARANPTQATARTNVVNGATAVLILLEARSPNAKRTLEVNEFSTDHRVYEFLPATFNVKFANVGNVHTIPAGTIFISHGSKQIATLDLNPSFGNILPGTKRIYTDSWADGFPHYENVKVDGKDKLDKKGRPVRHLVWSLSQLGKMRMGHYTAHLLAIYDDGHRDVPVEANLSFWVIPWRILLVMLVLISLIVGGVYLALRGTLRSVRRLKRRKR